MQRGKSGGVILITRIEIDGFKTFRNFALDLEPFQVIVGPNAAGKSNLFDALRLLSRVAETDLMTAFHESRGESGELFTIMPDGEPVKKMKFAVELLLDRFVTDNWGRTAELIQTRVRYELHIERQTDSRGLDHLRVTHETLTPILAKSDTWAKRKRSGAWSNAFSYRRKTPFISTITSGIPTVTLHQDARQGRQRQVPLDKLSSTLLSSLTTAEFPHGFATREEIRNWTYLQLSPESLRSPSSRLAPAKLDATGRYLANVLARMKKEDEFALTDVASDLANLVPGIIKIDVEEDEAKDRYVIWATSADGRQFSSRVLSDGTLRLLALATIKNDPDYGGVLMFEEPENGVHPFRIKKVAALLRDMTTRFDEPGTSEPRLRQLLVNTHSPTLVSHLREPEMIFAHLVDVFVPEQKQPLRVTKMVPVKHELFGSEDHYTLLEMLQYLDKKDLEAASSRLRGELR